MRYIVFDVETPNRLNNRMSAIGISVVEDGKIVREIYSLVDPEQEFDHFNTMLTGIDAEAVRGKPNFRELWEEIGPVMTSGLLVAHNAPFDMGVLMKCLDRYDIDGPEHFEYACTCRMSRSLLPFLPDHKLNTVSEFFGIELNHHRAGSDAHAAAEILIRLIDRGCDVGSFIRIR